MVGGSSLSEVIAFPNWPGDACAHVDHSDLNQGSSPFNMRQEAD